MMKVLCVQSPRIPYESAFQYLDDLKSEIESIEFDFMVLPEKWITTEIPHGGEEWNGLLSFFEKLSSEHSATIVPGSFSVRRHSSLFNTAPVISEGRFQGYQDKIALFQNEKEKYSGGDEIRLFHAGSTPFSVAVCYDLDFPYFAKVAIEKGAQFLINPSLIASEFKEMWHLYVKGRSLENRLVVVSVNSASDKFLGGSIITSMRPFNRGIVIEANSMDTRHFQLFTTNPEEMKPHIDARKEEDNGVYSFRKS